MICYFLLIVIGYLVTLVIGNLFVGWICAELGITKAKDSGLESTGRVIGFFERFIILTFVLLNQYTALAFIFSAKSIARFKELEDRKFAEYYLVGTLASVSFALSCGLIMKFLFKIINLGP